MGERIGSLIASLVMGAAMAGFGLFAWLFMDLLFGLVLAAMTAVPVAFIVWMLKLHNDAVKPSS